MKGDSRSKTFEKGTELGELLDWFVANVKTPAPTEPDGGPDWTSEKYVITIKKVHNTPKSKTR